MEGTLKRDIGLGSAVILVIANMIGTGVFTTSGFIVAELQSTQVLLWCWLIGGLFALVGALCYGELGAMFPKAGGEYAYLKESFGQMPAFVSGWISLIVGFSAPIAAAAIAFATYLLGEREEKWFSLDILGYELVSLNLISFVAIGAVIVLSYVHYHSVKVGKGVQNFLTAFKVFFIGALIVGGFLFGEGDIKRITEGLFEPSSSFSWGEFSIALIFVSFAYSGWNAASYLGAEIKAPQRNLPLSLILGTLFVIVLYLLLNLIYIYALPLEHISGMLQLGTGSSKALFGESIGSFIGIAIALGLLSVVSAMIMAGPRVYYAMSDDGLFFKRFKKVCAKRNTPVQAIFLQAVIAIGMILTATFETLLIYIGFTLSLSAVLTVAGLIKLRIEQPGVHRPYKTPFYPLVPLVFIAGNLGIVVFSFTNKPLVSLYGMLTIIIGIFFYYLISSGKFQTNLSKDIIR